MSSKAQLSPKQSLFIWTSQIVIIVGCVLGIGCCVYFFPTFFKMKKDINNKTNTIPGPQELAAYFKNNANTLSDDCMSFDGHALTIKAPMTLSETGLSKLQFKDGVKLNGMSITTSEIDLSGKVLFNNNINEIYAFAGGGVTSTIKAAYNSHFFGVPGKTEIGTAASGTLCQRSLPIGSFNNPSSGMYVKTTGNNHFLCLCTQNWIYRFSSHTPGTLTYALTGSDDYNTPGEYCVALV